MNRRRIEWVREFLITQMNHWVVILIIITMFRLFGKQEPRLLFWAMWGIVPFLLYVIRQKVKSFRWFYVLHFLIPSLVFAAPMEDGMVKGILGILMVVYSALSVRNKQQAADGFDGLIPPVVACGIGFGAYFLYRYQRGTDWEYCYVLAILIYFGCYFVYYFLNQYLQFLTYNESSAANIPERAIFHSGLQQIGLFTFFVILLMLLFSNIHWLEFLLSGLKKVIVAVLRFLFRGFTPEDKEIEIIIDEKVSGGMIAFEQGEAALVWKILEYIALVVLGIACLMGMVVLLVKVISYAKSHFRETTAREQEMTEEATIDVREKCSIVSEKRKERKVFGFFNNSEKIRKIFKKKILLEYGKSKQIEADERLNFKTAGEVCEPVDLTTLQDIYEKARYSAQMCTSDDVKAAKMAIKNSK